MVTHLLALGLILQAPVQGADSQAAFASARTEAIVRLAMARHAAADTSVRDYQSNFVKKMGEYFAYEMRPGNEGNVVIPLGQKDFNLAEVSAKILIPVGMLLATAGLFLLTNIDLASGYAGNILPALLVIGVGLGLVFATGFGMATLGVQASDSGVASATVNTMQQVGGSVGTALLNTIAAPVVIRAMRWATGSTRNARARAVYR